MISNRGLKFRLDCLYTIYSHCVQLKSNTTSVLMNETNWHFRRLAETLIISDDSSWMILAMNQFWVCMLKLMMISLANLCRDLSTHDWSKSVLRWRASASRLPWSRRVMTRCAFKFQSPSDIYQGSFQEIYKLKIQRK